MPDTRREAEMLVLLLDAGLYSRIQFSPRATGTEEKGRVDLTGGGIIPAQTPPRQETLRTSQ